MCRKYAPFHRAPSHSPSSPGKFCSSRDSTLASAAQWDCLHHCPSDGDHFSSHLAKTSTNLDILYTATKINNRRKREREKTNYTKDPRIINITVHFIVHVELTHTFKKSCQSLL